MYENEILKFVDDSRGAIINDTIDLIGIPSISENTEETKNALTKAIEIGKKLGFKTELLLDNTIGIIEFGEGPETIGILAHVDVVGVDNESEWEFPPFEGVVSDDWICGRGAMDDKGPLIASLYAMKAIKDTQLPVYKKIRLIIGTQEEVNWTDMNEYTKKYTLPDYGFTPDGEFPLTNREKGYADVHMEFKKIFEKGGDFEIASIDGGTAINVVPSLAKAALRGEIDLFKEKLKHYLLENDSHRINFTLCDGLIIVTSEGIATHSCFPEKGVNAISILCNFLSTLSLTKNGGEGLIKFVSENIYGDIYGKSLGLYKESEYVNGEYMHRTVLSPTIVKRQGDSFNLSFNLRTVYGTTKDDIAKAFDKLQEEYGYTYDIADCMDPIYVSKERPFLKVMAVAYEKISGFKNEFSLAYGTSYAKAMSNFVSWGPVFPGDVDYCHEINERISISKLIISSKIYACSLAEMAFTQELLK